MPSPSPTAILSGFLAQPALAKLPRVLVVACSGGADSVALLRAAAEAGPRLGWRVEALHCDHGLRREAKRDGAFVRELCRRLDLTLHEFVTRVGKGPGMELRARTWRRHCYARAARSAGAALVLLGQHAQDQAETVILNLVRGAGAKGAAGMVALAPMEGKPDLRLGRPWLGLEPAVLRAWLRRKRQPWREDASNRDQGLARNRVRHAVLPVLVAINPKAVPHLAAFAAGLAASKADQDLAGLLKLDRAARRRAQAVLARGQGQADLGRGWTLRASRGQVQVELGSGANLSSPQSLRPGVELRWGGQWRFSLKLAEPTARKLKDSKVFWFDPAVMDDGLAVRALRPGERFQPYGAAGSRPLFDLLSEAGVPTWQRAGWPVLVSGERLLGLPAVRRARGYEAVAGKKALCLQWFRVPPSAGLP